jgi:precorrin-6A/cobalt-precorrin-6A reductase
VRVLILGGTGDAAELVAKLATIPKIEAIASLAGRTHQPKIPVGNVRIGGFGGVAGLVDYLRLMEIDILIDATHPFAEQISLHALAASTQLGIPRLMLNRPPWEPESGDSWIEVESIRDAAIAIPNLGKKVFLTIGRQEIGAFSHLRETWFLMRMIDPPDTDVILPPGLLLCDRGPFTLDHERQILQEYNIDLIVSKNSGGNATYPKIIAARELGIKVVIVNRPPTPSGEQVGNLEKAIAWLQEKIR